MKVHAGLPWSFQRASGNPEQQLRLYVEIRNRHGREGLDCGETGELGEDLGRQGCVTFPFGSVHRLLIPGRKRGLEAEVDTVVQSEEIASLGGFLGVLMTTRLQIHEQS